MHYNYDFHLHHQLIDAVQMSGGFESFYYNRNVRNVSCYGKSNLLPSPRLICYIESQIPGKRFLIVLQKFTGRRRKLLFFHPLLWETFGPMSSKVDVMKSLQYILLNIWVFWHLVTLYSMPRGWEHNCKVNGRA